MGRGNKGGKGGGGSKSKKGLTAAQKKVADKARRDKQTAYRETRQTELLAAQQAERAKQQQQMADKAVRKRERDQAKQLRCGEIARDWNQQINAIVDQVKQLRAANPGRQGINAGENAGAGDTLGGTENPIQLHLPANAYGIEMAEVLKTMAGFDQSDSGTYKFRRGGSGDIFVHAH